MRELEGVRVVVTRAARQAQDLAAPLRERGAETILLPVIAIAPPENPEPLRRAAQSAEAYDWIIFTSTNALDAFAAEPVGRNPPSRPRIATIGTTTREAAEAKGFKVSMTPDRYVAESLLEAFRVHDLNGKRVLIPSAAVTRDVIPTELRKLGAQVDVVEAYRNTMPAGAAAQAARVFRDPFPDWTLFASPSTVDNLVKLIGTEPLRKTKVASIGPVTSAAVKGHGLNVDAEARPHTSAGLVGALCAACVMIRKGQ
ncbi:MAG: uroporphyrinogen-III synthase [Acidobacteriaceae bacterium]|nr:uroporphyrinogen-III synthase [Acidobacteriaceae bacterium]